MKTLYIRATTGETIPEGHCVVPDHWKLSYRMSLSASITLVKLLEVLQTRYETLRIGYLSLDTDHNVIEVVIRSNFSNPSFDFINPDILISAEKYQEICYCR